jgi:hypothetical protein
MRSTFVSEGCCNMRVTQSTWLMPSAVDERKLELACCDMLAGHSCGAWIWGTRCAPHPNSKCTFALQTACEAFLSTVLHILKLSGQ